MTTKLRVGIIGSGGIAGVHIRGYLGSGRYEIVGLADLEESAMAEKDAASAPPAVPPPGMDETQRRVWDFLGQGPRHLDEMVQELGLAVGSLSGMLLALEMKRVVRRLPGNRYERV